jgi:preprotein translocase SecE subunit
VKYGFKRWFFGLGKEFNRISWASRHKVLWNFLVILLIITFLALLFLGLDELFITLLK